MASPEPALAALGPGQHQLSESSSTSSGEARSASKDAGTRPKANSVSVANIASQVENKASPKEVRTLPPWIDSFEETDEALDNAKPTDGLLSSPPAAHSAQHHYTPSAPPRRVSHDGYVDTYDDADTHGTERKHDTGFFGVHREPVKGRKWDHAREGDPVILRAPAQQNGSSSASSSWNSYIRSSMYGPAPSDHGERVDENFLEQQTPGYQRPWRGDLEKASEDQEKLSGLLYSRKRRKTLLKRIQTNLLMHPLVPLIFRITVLATSCIALGLSGSIFHLSNEYFYDQNPSTIMAIVVDVVAIPYIVYFTWDEYTGRPLGLRSPKTKIRLVLIDLFFIIFESANISLAFASLRDEDGSCRAGPTPTNVSICGRTRALCGILMVALIAWNATFTISIFRLVERVGGREEATPNWS